MKTIIVPVDFSPVSINAMNYAANMASSIDASIILFHAYQVPVAFSEVPVVTISMDEMKKISEEKMDELKRNLEHITSGKIKIYAESRLGDTIDELESYCKTINPFAVVMGTRGAGAIERLFMGSNTLSAIRHLNWPVITVPPGAVFHGIRKIGFACDFQKVVETTPVQIIKDLCGMFNAKLLILNVDYKNKGFKPDIPEQSLLLHTMLEKLNPSYHFIDNPNVEEGIDSFAETHAIDLIITIPKKHKLTEGLFQKSHTRELAFHSHIPLLAIHE
jgi:nucleotide-binding universal stress UspA family protein